MNLELALASLDSLKDPFVLADTDHVIVYMNRAGAENYKKWGGAELVGKSLLDCHNDASCTAIREITEAMRAGEDERMIAENERRRIFMRAVRAEDGTLLGYYERYEWPQGSP